MAFLQDVAAAWFREAFEDQAHRFAAGVHLCRAVLGDRLAHAAGVGVAGFVDNAHGST